MSVPLEGVIGPFLPQDVTPTRFTKPGQGSVPVVRIQVGYTGSVKSLGFSVSATVTSKMGQAHHEKAPSSSEALQTQLAQAAGG